MEGVGFEVEAAAGVVEEDEPDSDFVSVFGVLSGFVSEALSVDVFEAVDDDRLSVL